MSVLKYLSIKQYLPRSLFARSLLILILPIMLTLVISTYVFFDRHWEKMANRLALAVAGEVAFIVEQVQENPSEDQMENLRRDTLNHMQLGVKFVPGGKIIPDPVRYYGRGDIIKKTLSFELESQLRLPYRIIVDVEEKWTQVQVQLPEGALIVTSPEKRLFSSSGYVFLFWMIGVSCILMVVAILFMRNQIRPIKRLAIAADRFGKGRDVPFFKEEGAREVRQASRAFIGMRDRLNRQIHQRTSMLAGVSHDLRTPLTRLKLHLEMMPENEDTKALKSDIAEMQRMLDAYLQFAQGEGNEAMERLDIQDVLERVVKNVTRDGFPIEMQVTGKDFYMFMRPVAFERCFTNLISNAQKYAKSAVITLTERNEDFLFMIDDDGQGIEPKNYDEVFKPFYREEKSRNSRTGGVGLGLPIAQDIILAHGGDISLDQSPQGGLRVIVQLPK